MICFCSSEGVTRFGRKLSRLGVILETIVRRAQVYFGPLGPRGESVVRYLEAFDGVPRCPPRSNPAGWMLDVLASAFSPSSFNPAATPLLLESPLATEPLAGGSSRSAVPSGPEFHAAYFASTQWVGGLEARLAQLCTQERGLQRSWGKAASMAAPRAALSWAAQLVALTAREWRTAYRDLPYNMGRILGECMGGEYACCQMYAVSDVEPSQLSSAFRSSME